MSENVIRIQGNARFKFRSDTLANWESENPVLLSGEPGVVTDGTETEKIKLGDGVTAWNDLGWWKGPKGDVPSADDLVGLQKYFADVQETEDSKGKNLDLFFHYIVTTLQAGPVFKIKAGQINLEDDGGSVKIENGVISTNSNKNQMDFVNGEDFHTPIPIKIGNPEQPYHSATKEYVDNLFSSIINGNEVSY